MMRAGDRRPSCSRGTRRQAAGVAAQALMRGQPQAAMDSVSGKPRMPIMGRTIVTLIVLAVTPIAINDQALTQLVDVPQEAISAVNVLFDMINKRTHIWINPQLKGIASASRGNSNFFSIGSAI